jgi:hypothetical protein
MNQGFNMKKLTAFLLGTVISIAFTADAFADPRGVAKKYWNSNDGKTGSYLAVSYNRGNIGDVEASYSRGAADETWKLDDGEGANIQLGYDFGKIRFDWRLGALKSEVETISGAALAAGKSNDAVLGYSTFNLDFDIYRFELQKAIAITPYVGAGVGYGGGWMTGRKAAKSTLPIRGDVAGSGVVWSGEAGILVNLTDWAGITLGYNYLDITVNGENVTNQLASVGVRFTY